MDEKVIENIRNLKDGRKKEIIIKEAFDEIKFSKRSVVQYFVSILTAILLSIVIGWSIETVDIMRETTSRITELLLAFMAMIFGTYAIFQALLSKPLIKVLIKSDNNILKESNTSFVNLIILYAIGVILTFVISTILTTIPEDFIIANNLIFSNILAVVLIAFYLSFCFLLFTEIFNFAINMYRMFSAYNTLNALDATEDE